MQMNSQKRKIILNGICIIFVVSLPLTLGMFRIQNVHGDVDYWQGLAIIIITAIIVAVIQTSVSMWYQKKKDMTTNGEFQAQVIKIKTACAVLRWLALVISGALMTGALRIMGWNDPLPYIMMAIIAVVALVLIVATTWILKK
jgi:phosphatidylserine synthase